MDGRDAIGTRVIIIRVIKATIITRVIRATIIIREIKATIIARVIIIREIKATIITYVIISPPVIPSLTLSSSVASTNSRMKDYSPCT